MPHKILYIICFSILAILSSCQFVNTSDSTSLPESEINFAIADTSSITKIFIADAGDGEVLLERKSVNHWTIDGETRVRQDAIDMLLKTMKRIRVKRPVSHSAVNNVIKELAVKHRKVEIYTRNANKPAKVYYIGGNTLDNKGNHMLLEGAENPYVVHIPGFSGFVSARYFMKKEDWKDRSVFKYLPQEIAFIEVNYPENPEDGFRLTPKNLESYVLSSLDKNRATQTKPVATKTAYDYLSAYRNLNLESFVNDYSFKDNLKESMPLAQIAVQPKNGPLKTLVIYRMPTNKRSKGRVTGSGNVREYDPDRFYAFVNDSDFVVIQNFIFGKVMRTYDFFFENEEK